MTAYDSIHAHLCARGLTPELQRLDNEASAALQLSMQTKKVNFQLVPPTIIVTMLQNVAFAPSKTTSLQVFAAPTPIFLSINGIPFFRKLRSQSIYFDLHASIQSSPATVSSTESSTTTAHPYHHLAHGLSFTTSPITVLLGHHMAFTVGISVLPSYTIDITSVTSLLPTHNGILKRWLSSRITFPCFAHPQLTLRPMQHWI